MKRWRVYYEICRYTISLQWRHNGRDRVSNHLHPYCLFNRLFRQRSKETSKLRVTGPRAGNSPVTGAFHAQRASNAENVSIWWRHHDSRQISHLKYTDSRRISHLVTCYRILDITVTSHEHHGVSNYRQLNRLLNSFFNLTTKKTLMLWIIVSLWGEQPINGGFLAKSHQ